MQADRKGKENEMFYLTTHSIHFIYGYMASDIWFRTIQMVRKVTRCRRLTARVLLYAPSHRQDSTYHGLWYTSRGVLVGTGNSSMGPLHEGSIRRPIAPWSYISLPERNDELNTFYYIWSTPWRIDPTTHRTTSERSYHGATSRSCGQIETQD